MLAHLPLAFGVLLLGFRMPSLPPTVTTASWPEQELAPIYTRSSRYLDTRWDGRGWRSAVPAEPYRETERSSAGNLRLQLTFASFYRFRTDAAARNMAQTALRDALQRLAATPNAVPLNGQLVSTRSFHEAIGFYLALRLLERDPQLQSPEERRATLASIKAALPWVLQASDTENRAALGAAYGLAVLNHPLLSFSPGERRQHLDQVRRKAETALAAVGADRRYREGTPPQFSLHYHLVTAAMLYYIGGALAEPRYREIADRMVETVRSDYPLGKLDAHPSHRPRGIGLQTVLLRAVVERYAGTPRWERAWRIEQRGRGFIDPAAPHRLAWRDQVDGTFNDDYSFASIAELFWDTLER